MATLAFEVNADYEKVIRLRDEVARLQQTLNALQGNGSVQAIATLDQQLATAREELRQMVSVAAQASASLSQLNDPATLNGMAFATVGEKITALSAAIENNKIIIAEHTALLRQWQQDAAEAYANGDTGTLQAITADITDQIARIRELTNETTGYETVLQGVMSMAGMGAGGEVNVPRLYDSVDDLQNVEYLKQAITDLQEQIAAVGADGGDTTALTLQLSETREELINIQASAAQTAADLGDLGARAADAQQQVYALDRAVVEQQEVIAALSLALEEADDNLTSLQKSDAATSEQVEAAVAAYDTLSQSLANANDELLVLQQQQETAHEALQTANDEIEKQNSVLVKALGGYENYTTILNNLPGPVKSVITGIAGMTKASWAFIATPLGAIIGAIVLALKALFEWFHNSAEGQQAFAKVSGYVSGVLGQLKEIVYAVGKAIYNAFHDPKKAVTDLWETIKNNFLNRVKGIGQVFGDLGKVIKAVFTFQWDDAKEALKDFGNSLVQTLTGVEDAGGKIANAMNKAASAVKKTASLEEREIALQKQRSAQQVEDAEYEKRINELRNKSRQGTDEEQLAATQEAMKLINERYDKQIALAQEAYDIQKERNKLTTNSLEDQAKENQLAAQITKLEAQRARAQTRFTSRENTLSRRSDKSAASAARAEVKEEQKAQQERQRAQEKADAELLALQAKNQKERIDLMADGTAKTLALIEYDYQQRRAAILQEQEKLAELNSKAGLTDTNDNGLTADQQGEIDAQNAVNDARRQKSTEEAYAAERAAMRDYLKEYGDFEQQRLAIAEEYEAKIAAAQTTGEKMLLAAQRNEALHALDVDFIDNTRWDALFDNIDSLSRSQLQKLQEELEEMLSDETLSFDRLQALSENLATVNKALVDRGNAFAAAMGRSSEKTKTVLKLQEDILNYQRQINAATLAQKQTLTDIEDIKQQICDLVEGKIDIEVNVDKLTIDNADAIISELEKSGDSTGAGQTQNLFSQWASLSQQSQQLGSTISSLTAESDAAGAALEGMGGAAGGGAEAIAIIDTIVHNINDGVQGMNELLDQMGLSDSKFGKGWQAFAESSEYATQGWESLKSGDVMGVVNGVFGSLRTLGDALGAWGISFMGETDKTLHEDMETLSFSNDALKASIDELSEEINKLTTSLSDAAQDYETAMYNLEKMEQDTQEIMQRAGKNRDQGFLGIGSDASTNGKINEAMTSDDWGRISRAAGVMVTSAGDFWRLTSEQMYNVSVQEAALYAKIKQHADDGHEDVSQYMDEYIGYYQQMLDLQDEWNEKLTATSLDGLVSSFQSAIMDMEHTSADFANDFEELMKNAVVSSLVSSKYADMLSDWYDDFAEAMEDDYMISSSEQERLRERYQDIVDTATDEIEELYRMMGWSTTANTQTAQSTAWQTMSEDTGQELNGRFTAMYESLIRHETLSEGLAAQGDLLNDIAANTRDILASSYLELQEIRDNTERAADYLRGIRSDIAAVKENTEQI